MDNLLLIVSLCMVKAIRIHRIKLGQMQPAMIQTRFCFSIVLSVAPLLTHETLQYNHMTGQEKNMRCSAPLDSCKSTCRCR